MSWNFDFILQFINLKLFMKHQMKVKKFILLNLSYLLFKVENFKEISIKKFHFSC